MGTWTRSLLTLALMLALGSAKELFAQVDGCLAPTQAATENPFIFSLTEPAREAWLGITRALANRFASYRPFRQPFSLNEFPSPGREAIFPFNSDDFAKHWFVERLSVLTSRNRLAEALRLERRRLTPNLSLQEAQEAQLNEYDLFLLNRGTVHRDEELYFREFYSQLHRLGFNQNLNPTFLNELIERTEIEILVAIIQLKEADLVNLLEFLSSGWYFLDPERRVPDLLEPLKFIRLILEPQGGLLTYLFNIERIALERLMGNESLAAFSSVGRALVAPFAFLNGIEGYQVSDSTPVVASRLLEMGLISDRNRIRVGRALDHIAFEIDFSSNETGKIFARAEIRKLARKRIALGVYTNGPARYLLSRPLSDQE